MIINVSNMDGIVVKWNCLHGSRSELNVYILRLFRFVGTLASVSRVVAFW